MSGRKAGLVCILVLLVVPLIYFRGSLLLNSIPYSGDLTGSDLWSLNLPRRVAYGESLHSGHLPLWLSGIHGGMPNVGEGQTGIFYPPNLVLFSLLPPVAAFNYSIILTFFLAGLFTYFYCRSVGLGRGPSLLAGIAFMMSAFFVVRMKHVNMINTAAWVPLLFYFAEAFHRQRKVRYAVYAGIVIAVQLTAGHPQIAHFSVVALAGYFLFGIVRDVLDGRRSDLRVSKKGVLLYVTSFVLAVVVGLSLAAVQVMPTMELSGLSNRGGEASYENATSYPFTYGSFATLFSPFAQGNPAKNDSSGQEDLIEKGVFWENNAYIGLLPVLLAFFGAVLCRRDRWVKFWIIAIAAAFLLALGAQTPVFKAAWSVIPGMKYFRFPNRFILFAQFGLAVLAAFGLQGVMRLIVGKGDKRRVISIVTAAAAVVITVANLLWFGCNYNSRVDAKAWLAPPKTVEFIKRDESVFRIYSFMSGTLWWYADSIDGGWLGDKEALREVRELVQPDDQLLYGLEGFGDRAAFEGGLGIERRTRIEKALLGQFQQTGPYTVKAPRSALRTLGLYNVKYILSPFTLVSPDLVERLDVPLDAFSGEGISVHVYENRLCFPRAFVVQRVRCETGEDALKGVFDRGFDPRTEVISEDEYPSLGDGGLVEAGIVRYENCLVEIEAEAPDAGGYLVLADNYYPGWRAEVDGSPVGITRANGISRMVPLEGGEHRVVFTYRPESYRDGLIISLASVIVLAAMGIAGALRRRRG